MSTYENSIIISRDFYLRDGNELAPLLLGKLLVHNTPEGLTSGIIVEVEAYIGPDDKGSHAYGNRRTERTKIQYGVGGYAYIYSIYGMHSCFNIVANKEMAFLSKKLGEIDVNVPLDDDLENLKSESDENVDNDS